jgi:phage shock protein B
VEDVFLPIVVVGMLFIGLPWIVLHYLTQWRKASSISVEDENLLDDLYETAKRLEARLDTVERIVAADHPDFRPGRP